MKGNISKYVFVAIGLVFLTLLVLPMSTICRSGGTKPYTIYNFKQAATGLMIYLEDHNGYLPSSFKTNDDLKVSLYGYVANEKVLQSVEDRGAEMIPNIKIEGMHYESFADPSSLVLLIEDRNQEDGSRIVSMADSATRSVFNAFGLRREPISAGPIGMKRVLEARSDAYGRAINQWGDKYFVSWSKKLQWEILVEKWHESRWEIVYEVTATKQPTVVETNDKVRIDFVPSVSDWKSQAMREGLGLQSVTVSAKVF